MNDSFDLARLSGSFYAHMAGEVQPESKSQPALTISDDEFGQALKTLHLLEAKSKAEAAAYGTRLAMEQLRPHRLYPVMIYNDGLRWVCSYGVFGEQYQDYLPARALGQSGVEAFGTTPEEAAHNFDRMWVGKFEEASDDECDTGRGEDD
jgi:hypothetical protein